MRPFLDSSFLYTIISALATLAFACSSLICAQKKTNRQRIAGGLLGPGVVQEVSLIQPTIKGDIFLQTAIQPSASTEEKSKGSKGRNKKSKPDKHDKKKKNSKNEKPADKKTPQKKEKKAEMKKEETPVKAMKKEEAKKDKIDKHTPKTAEHPEFEAPKKSDCGGVEKNKKLKSLEINKTVKTEEDRKKSEDDKKNYGSYDIEADDFSEKVDVRLQSNIQRPLVGQSLVETLPVDERLRSQM